MIVVINKVIPAIIPGARVNKADRVVKQAQGAVIQKTRNSRAEQARAISKAICPIMTAGRAGKKKLLQGVIIHIMMMTRTQNNQGTKLQTGIRTQTVA
jgi:hypothetical protein